MLNKYLGKNPCDLEGWVELADCYLEVSSYNKALHCYNQLVILEPNNLNYVQMLAEVNIFKFILDFLNRWRIIKFINC